MEIKVAATLAAFEEARASGRDKTKTYHAKEAWKMAVFRRDKRAAEEAAWSASERARWEHQESANAPFADPDYRGIVVARVDSSIESYDAKLGETITERTLREVIVTDMATARQAVAYLEPELSGEAAEALAAEYVAAAAASASAAKKVAEDTTRRANADAAEAKADRRAQETLRARGVDIAALIAAAAPLGVAWQVVAAHAASRPDLRGGALTRWLLKRLEGDF